MGPIASWVFLTLLMLAGGLYCLEQIDQARHDTDRED